MIVEQVLNAVEEANQADLVLVLTTEVNLEKAELLAATLLEKGLVACVSCMPILSHYFWRGRTTRSDEVQLLLKTQPDSLERLYETVLELHSYETPEWITLGAQTRGAYGAWCFRQLAGGPAKASDGPPTP
ncbi:MAG: divalent-cation tolerance protein CutA [Cyanobacteriota bacterium]|nr:divalent-cation tolerance protein CutA [Cyanobacteriota bacterium]